MLTWFSNSITSVKKALELGYKIQKYEVEGVQPQQIPDSFVDRDVVDVKDYFTSTAWEIVQQTSERYNINENANKLLYKYA